MQAAQNPGIRRVALQALLGEKRIRLGSQIGLFISGLAVVSLARTMHDPSVARGFRVPKLGRFTTEYTGSVLTCTVRMCDQVKHARLASGQALLAFGKPHLTASLCSGRGACRLRSRQGGE